MAGGAKWQFGAYTKIAVLLFRHVWRLKCRSRSWNLRTLAYMSVRSSSGGVSNLPSLCGVLLALLASSATAATQPALTVRVADVTAPAGGIAQIQVFLDSPHTLSGGELVMNVDPAV